MKLIGGDWSKGDLIALAGLFVAVVTTGLTVPEFRRDLGLDHEPQAQQQNHSADQSAIAGNGPTSVPVSQTTGNTSVDNQNGLKIGHAIVFDGFKYYGTAGFNFANATTVPWGTSKPDVEAANPDPGHASAVLFLENDTPPYTPKDWPEGKVPANGGIIKMSQQRLEDVREAPESGYSVHYFRADVGSVYCIRTWDGQHFAKILVTHVNVDRVGFDWAYQPSGSRHFE